MSMPPTPLQIDYIDPDGNDWNLSDRTMANGYICSGITGIEGIPVLMQTIPLLDGTAIPNLYIPQPGSVVIGILIGRPASDREMDYYAVLDSLVRAFLTRRNEIPAPGYLRVQRPDGTTRQLTVYTTSGLNTPEVAISNHSVYTFTLQSPDPYWQDMNPQTLVFALNVAPGILPVLPVQLSGGTVLGTTNVFNAGNAITYPTWTITGPGTPTMTNQRTGFQWSLNTAIPAGQVVQVVTKPGQQMAVNQTTGANIWSQLVLSSLRQLWALMAGNNPVNISMLGATAATSVNLQWTNRWNRA
jgi:hypothetical protein